MSIIRITISVLDKIFRCRKIEGLIKCEQTNEERLRLFLDCFIVWETRMLNTCLCYEIIPLPYL